jgi:hypothetical protein
MVAWIVVTAVAVGLVALAVHRLKRAARKLEQILAEIDSPEEIPQPRTVTGDTPGT